ncbi:biotin biosynthesis protein BioC [Anaerohalosphaera lusitana]|uniref:Biotin biosynthesis protein BioC n=1 Tax=Anaerohalosphaera lusitana TaxID=1936003 RepID=A0A1U9NNB7_9BACT|nr:class I SAM-dependent methyltransferase [Anaerohalosphaera lusitana]AQT69442.1 biotin biosynthesis protein BioC [Anaerohalosphaera lusitana]
MKTISLRSSKQYVSPQKLEEDTGIKLRTYNCPSCESQDVHCFYHVPELPVHSVLLLKSVEAAKNCMRGDVALGMCLHCGFVANLAFDESLIHYGTDCEESQAFSSVFNVFHKRLADYLINKYNLKNKRIIEIGCGKGEFLTLLCKQGGNQGLGFDPAYVPGRNEEESTVDVDFVQDFYSSDYADENADFICCKMTLEHINDTGNFIQQLRDNIGNQHDTTVFFQVPNITRIFNEIAFWDVYYEHCSYFSDSSLCNLFEMCGFKILRSWSDYGSQYLMIEARPAENNTWPEDCVKPEMLGLTRHFSSSVMHVRDRWKKYLNRNHEQRKRTILWGSGSKAVSFLNSLRIGKEIEYIVDINAFRQNTYSAGTAQKIVRPQFLKEYKPDEVVIMNPIYRDEIGGSLAKMGLTPKISTVLLPDVMGAL